MKKAEKKKHKIVVVCGKHKHVVNVSGKHTITVWKLGDAKLGWIPNRSYFEAFRDLLLKAMEDPEFHIIWNYGLEVDQVEVGYEKKQARKRSRS